MILTTLSIDRHIFFKKEHQCGKVYITAKHAWIITSLDISVFIMPIQNDKKVSSVANDDTKLKADEDKNQI